MENCAEALEKMDELRMFETFVPEELKRNNSTKNGREQDQHVKFLFPPVSSLGRCHNVLWA